MSRGLAAIVCLALACAAGPRPTAAAPALEATRALVAGLGRGGRAEVTLRWSVAGGPGAAPRRMRGTLAIEPPDRARLEVPATGERITLRADGGEWLQPSLHQMMLLKSRHSVAAMRWWRLLAGGEGASEYRLATRRYRLLIPARAGLAADSAEVTLEANGLPAKLELDDGAGGLQSYELSAWRFTNARGAAAFRIAAPAGTETVELP